MPTSSLSRIAAILHLLRVTSMGPDDAALGKKTSPGRYASPTGGWSLEFDPARWKVVSTTSGGHTDTLTLAPHRATSEHTRATFHTSLRRENDLQAQLEHAAAALTRDIPGASLTVAVDIHGKPISWQSEEGHWIASYILSRPRYDDIIVELDAIALRRSRAVLEITVTAHPTDYDDLFYAAGALRKALSLDGRELISTITETGGSRPKVQY